MTGDAPFLDLEAIGLEDRARVGSKAAVLGALLRNRLPVAPGFALPEPDRWADAIEHQRLAARTDHCLWIVRSSALLEDGVGTSFAGLFESVGPVAPGADLLAAVRRVSKPGALACEHARRRGLELGEHISVLVQRHIDAVRAGVLFTVDPQGSRRLHFAIDWGAAEEVTGGTGEARLLTFDPFEPQAGGCTDPIVARALPRLVELAFATHATLHVERPLDIEWIIDGDERVWLVQARPVTAFVGAPDPRVRRLLEEGFELASPRPASRLGAWSFATAGAVDRRAARYHPGFFERRVVGQWLLVKRTKLLSRARIAARTPVGFLAAWIRARHRNLAFGLAHLAAWRVVSAIADRWARQVLGSDLHIIPDARLRKLVADALSLHRRVRQLHAALWYPVDLKKDLATFESQFGPPGLSATLPRPARRSARDQSTASLVIAIRDEHSGDHPAWEMLGAGARALILRHLVRFPYAFESSAEVQDPAAWRAWIEKPDEWWSRQASSTGDELVRQVSVPPRPPSPQCGFAASGLRAVVGAFALLKDDRVELLAQAGAALRRVLLELERRSGPDGADEGWIFELDAAELNQVAAALERPQQIQQLRSMAIRRAGIRRLEAISAMGSPPALAATGPRNVTDGAGVQLRGVALATGAATGKVCRADSAGEAQRILRTGEVLVIEELRPAFTSVLPRAAALICRRGSPLSHGAIIARELGIPAVALEDLTKLPSGAVITVDGTSGFVTVHGFATRERRPEKPSTRNGLQLTH